MSSSSCRADRFQPKIEAVVAVPARPHQREHLSDERQLSDGDAIDEIGPAAVDRVVNFQDVFAIMRDVEEEDRIRVETVVIGRGQFRAVRFGHGHQGLEPAGDGVGEIRDQMAGLRHDEQFLASARLKMEAVRLPAKDLAIQHHGRSDKRSFASSGRGRGGQAEAGSRRTGKGRGRGGSGDRARRHFIRRRGKRFGVIAARFADLRELADLEEQGIRQACGGPKPDFPVSDRRVRRDGHRKGHRFGKRLLRAVAPRPDELVRHLLQLHKVHLVEGFGAPAGRAGERGPCWPGPRPAPQAARFRRTH